MRTLTIGDRTISYDTGLNYGSSPHDMSRSQLSDGSELPGEQGTSTSSEADYSGTASICSEDHEDGEAMFGREGSRKKIKPDLVAMSQLLNFDEEDEDGLESEEEEREEGEKAPSSTEWQKTVVKDLTQRRCRPVERRHSISLCHNSYRLKAAVYSSNTNSNNSSKNSSPKTSFSSQTSEQLRRESSPPYRLNTSEMHANLQYNSPEWQRALQTLNLSLDEVAHIRSVLTKAELESLPLEGSMKESVGKGKICFLCMKTKFGIFSRGQKCQMCKQMVCSRCHTKMNIPVEYFTATPVYALSPLQEAGQCPPKQSGQRAPVFRLGVPSMPGSTNSAGSAPSSPSLSRRVSEGYLGKFASLSLENSYLGYTGISTISGLTSLPPVNRVPASFQPVSLQPTLKRYNTLPNKCRAERRWSMVSTSRPSQREKLEGSPLNVCLDCKEMVLQVIRTSRTTKKMQLARSMFFNNLNPSNYNFHHRL